MMPDGSSVVAFLSACVHEQQLQICPGIAWELTLVPSLKCQTAAAPLAPMLDVILLGQQ